MNSSNLRTPPRSKDSYVPGMGLGNYTTMYYWCITQDIVAGFHLGGGGKGALSNFVLQ